MEISNINFASELAKLLKPLEQRSSHKLKLVIHAGTPKTGTTSLQSYLTKKQGKLRRKGILYPHNLEKLRNPSAPEHQWLEKNLAASHGEYLLENFKNVVSQVKEDTHTILLSSEGIYNYWWDFPDESKGYLAELVKLFDTTIWVWFREPIEFIESYYKQCIRNPKVHSNPCYGKDLSFTQMLDIDWFAQHLDYQGFVDDCQMLFGTNNVVAFEYQGDVVQAVIEQLGLATPHDNPTPRQNKSLNSLSIALLRTINQFELSAKDKERLMPHLRAIDGVLERCDNSLIIDKLSRKKVLALSRPIKF